MFKIIYGAKEAAGTIDRVAMELVITYMRAEEIKEKPVSINHVRHLLGSGIVLLQAHRHRGAQRVVGDDILVPRKEVVGRLFLVADDEFAIDDLRQGADAGAAYSRGGGGGAARLAGEGRRGAMAPGEHCRRQSLRGREHSDKLSCQCVAYFASTDHSSLAARTSDLGKIGRVEMSEERACPGCPIYRGRSIISIDGLGWYNVRTDGNETRSI